MAAAAWFAFSRGQDVNYDQLNYHTYAAYAFLNGRLDVDAAPAQIFHTYFNPLAFVPHFLVFSLWGPVAATLVVGALQGLALAVAASVAVAVNGSGTSIQRRLCLASAVVISAASPMALCEVGTSYTDITSAIPVLMSVALLLRTHSLKPSLLLTAGVLAGCGVALKLTNAPFAVGLAGTSLVYGPAMRSRICALAAVSAGLVLGFLLVGGHWCYQLWRRFGNPVFPYYNGIFLSPDYPPSSISDRRNLPIGVLDALAYPFRWAVGVVPQAEVRFHDIRYATIIVLLAAGGVVAVTHWLRHQRRPHHHDARLGTRLIMFYGLSSALWLVTFSFQRYIVVLELLCGPAAILAIGWLVGGWLRVSAAWGLAALSLLTVTVPDVGHVPFLPGSYGLRVPASLMDDGLFFVAGEPLSYVIPSFSSRASFFGISDWEDTTAGANTRITRRILAALQDSPNKNVRLIANSPMTLGTRWRLGSYGLQAAGECVRIPGYSSTGGIFACDLARMGTKGLAAYTLQTGAKTEFGPDGQGFLALTGAGTGDWALFGDSSWTHPQLPHWYLPGPVADLRSGHEPGLIYARSEAFAPTALSLRVTYRLPDAAADGFDLTIAVNGIPAGGAVRRVNWDEGTTELVGCVPRSVVEADTNLHVVFRADLRPGGPPLRPDMPRFQLCSFTALPVDVCG